MNAPAHKLTAAEVFPESDAERAYRQSISIHLPNQGEFEMACRVHIATMRDQAGAALSRCSDVAYPVLAHVAGLAARAVCAPMETKRLVLTRAALVQAMDAARALERAYK